jgi:hypothetical protein
MAGESKTAEEATPFELSEDEEFKSSGQYAASFKSSPRHIQTTTREHEEHRPRVGFERIATGELYVYNASRTNVHPPPSNGGKPGIA